MYIGIDIGGTKIESAIYDGVNVRNIARMTTPKTYEKFLIGLDKMIQQALEMGAQAIQGIGIGVPGTVKNNEISWVPNVGYLDKADLVKDLQEKYEVTIFIANDAQLSLLGEAWKGAASEKQHAVLISVGTGIGGAIMHNRNIIQGVRGAAGAFGWIHLDVNEPVSVNHGYLERYASGSAIMEMGRKLDPPLTSYEVMDKARQGDVDCLGIVHQVAHKLGVALAIVSSILEPEVIILSGGISDAFDVIREEMITTQKEYSSIGTKDIPIVVGELGSKAGVYGAIRAGMLRERMFRST